MEARWRRGDEGGGEVARRVTEVSGTGSRVSVVVAVRREEKSAGVSAGVVEASDG